MTSMGVPQMDISRQGVGRAPRGGQAPGRVPGEVTQGAGAVAAAGVAAGVSGCGRAGRGGPSPR